MHPADPMHPRIGPHASLGGDKGLNERSSTIVSLLKRGTVLVIVLAMLALYG